MYRISFKKLLSSKTVLFYIANGIRRKAAVHRENARCWHLNTSPDETTFAFVDKSHDEKIFSPHPSHGCSRTAQHLQFDVCLLLFTEKAAPFLFT